MILLPFTILSGTDKLYIELLHDSEKEKLWILAKRILEDEQLAQDAVQITFEKVINKLPMIRKLEKIGRAKGYIYIIAKNTALDLLRKKKYREHASINVLNEECRDWEFDTEEIAIQEIEKDKLAEYVKQLKPKYKEAIYLRYRLNLKYTEIAESTLTTSSNARYRVKSGIEMVRRMIEEGESIDQ